MSKNHSILPGLGISGVPSVPDRELSFIKVHVTMLEAVTIRCISRCRGTVHEFEMRTANVEINVQRKASQIGENSLLRTAVE